MARRTTFLTLLLLFAATNADAQMPDLKGGWRLKMPAGFEYDASFEPTGEAGRFRLKTKATLLRGVYELRQGKLSMIKPEDPKLIGLVWEVKDDSRIVLVEHPEQSRFGSDYRGAVLTRPRQVDPPKKDQ